MANERYPGNTDPQGDYYGRQETQDYGRDYGSGRDNSYSSARDYQAAGGEGRRGYGQRDDRYGSRDYGSRDQGRQAYGQSGDYGRGGYGRGGSGQGRYGQGDYGSGRAGQGGYGQGSYNQGGRAGGSGEYHGSYASDGRRFEDVGRYSHADDDDARDSRRGRAQGYGAQPQGYQYEERGFFQRAGDEVRSWFGDEDAERRRDMDQRYDERSYGSGDQYGQYGARGQHHQDHDYHSWRSGQIAALDRDYDEYRQENRSKFENEFSSWRTTRQGQRDSLSKVSEHMDVVGSDGEHVGTVDKVRGDRILLTKNDAEAGGRHHSIPSRWVESVDSQVKLTKTAAEAKQQWQDEERNQAMFQYGDKSDDASRAGQQGSDAQASSRSTSSAKTY